MHFSIQHQLLATGQICAKYGIARLEVFGSAARASDFFKRTSAADFLVKFLPATQPGLDKFFGAKAELEIILKRDVDLVHTKAFNNPDVVASVNQSRELVCAAP